MHGATGFIEVPATELTEKLASRLHTLVTSSAVQPPKTKEVPKQPPARPALVARPVPPPEPVEKSREESVLDVIVAKNRVKEDEIENTQKRRLQVLVDKMNQRSEKERRKKEKKRLEKEKAKASGESDAKKAGSTVEVASKPSAAVEKTVAPAGKVDASVSVEDAVREVVKGVDAVKPTEPVKQEGSVNAAEVVKPSGSGQPLKPVKQEMVKPKDATKPMEPVKPEKTVDSVSSKDSAKPVDSTPSSKPAEPMKPVDSPSAKPTEAAKPTDSSSAKPTDSSSAKLTDSSSAKPTDSTPSSKPAEPAKASKPSEPSKPAEPTQPKNPAKLEEPTKSADSPKTAEPAKHAESSHPPHNPKGTEKDTMSPLTVTPSVISVLEGSSALNRSAQSNAQTTSKTKRLFDTDRSSLGESSSIFSSLAETKKPVSRASHPVKTGKKSRSATPAKPHKESSRSATPAKAFRESSRNSQKTRVTQSMMSVDAAAYVRPDSPKNAIPPQDLREDASQPLRLDSDPFLPQNYGDDVLNDTGYGLHDLDWRMGGHYANPSVQQPYLYDSGGFSYGFSNPYRRVPDYRVDRFDRNLDRRFYDEYAMPSFMDYYDTMRRPQSQSYRPDMYRDPLLPVDPANDFWEGGNLNNGDHAHHFMDNDDVLADDYEDTPLNLRDPDSLVFPESRSSSVTLHPHAQDLPQTNHSGDEPVV